MSNAIIEYLAEAGQRAPSADNSQPWLFLLNDQGIDLYIDLKRIEPSCFDANHPAILLAMGAVIENILQAANWIGIDIEYDYFFDQDDGKYAAFVIENIPNELPANARQHPLFSRTTNRYPYSEKPIPSNIVEDISNLSSSNIKIEFFQERKDINQWAQWNQIASEVRFQTPDIHEWFGQSLKFTDETRASNEGLDVNTLGLPTIGLFFLKLTQTWKRMNFCNKFGAYKLIAKMEGMNLKKTSAILTLTGPLDNPTSIEAGRVMQRVWIKLNEAGLSVQPHFVIPDQLYRFKQAKIAPKFVTKLKALENSLQSKIQDKFIYMVFRVGFCERRPVKSLRREIRQQPL